MPWFPELPSCYDVYPQPPTSCPGPEESIWSAFSALSNMVASSCTTCVQWVFDRLGSGYSDKQKFFDFLHNGPGFYDATRSNMPQSNLCHLGGWNGPSFDGSGCAFSPHGIYLLVSGQTIAQFFKAYDGTEPSGLEVDAISEMPAKLGPLVFFRPSSVCATISSQTTGFFNQAQLFHEALHGFYGKDDMTIQTAFGLNTNDPSENISEYIQNTVFGQRMENCAN